MALEPAALVAACVEGLKSYRPGVETIDTHVANVLKAHAKASAEDAVFLQQVIYGVTRSAPCLRVFLNAVYHVHAASLPRSQHTLFSVLAYLLIFRLPELGWPRIAAILRCYDVATMHVLLSFLFNPASMEEWVKEGWCRVLDRGYVEGTLLATLARFAPQAHKWLAEHETEAFGARVATSSTSHSTGDAATATRPASMPQRAVTVPHSPRLTTPKPRPVMVPVEAPAKATARPMPAQLDTVTLAGLQTMAAARRAVSHSRTRDKYHPDRDTFNLHTTRATVDRVRAEVEAARMAEWRPDGFKARPPPHLPPKGADVRLNAAAILREDAVFKRRQAADAEAIRRFEMERRDTSGHFAAIAMAKEKDEAERVATVRARKAELSAAARRAAAAAQRHAAEKAAQVNAMRAEAAAWQEAREAERVAAVAANRAMVQSVKAETEGGGAAARAALMIEHATLAAEVKEEGERLVREGAVARQAEAAAHHDVIRRIRALERVPRVAVKVFDPTSVPGHGLLEEMSLVELHERLAIMQAQREEEVHHKRATLIQGAREREEVMLARAANLAQLRTAAALASREARAHRVAEAATQAAVAEEARKDAAVEVHHRIMAKHQVQEAERARLAEERRRIHTENQFIGATKAMLEERRLAGVFAGAQRRIASETAARTAHALEASRTAALKRGALEHRAAQAALAEVERKRAGDAAVASAAREAKEWALAELSARERRFLHAVEAEATLRDLRDAADPYGAGVRRAERDAAAAARAASEVGAPGRRDVRSLSPAAHRHRTVQARLSRLVDGAAAEGEGAPLRHAMTVRAAATALAAGDEAGGYMGPVSGGAA